MDGEQIELGQADKNVDGGILPNVLRVHCGWHIIGHSWNSHVPNIKILPQHASAEVEPNFKLVKDVVVAWLYSWIKPVVETEEEYTFSKQLLLT